MLRTIRVGVIVASLLSAVIQVLFFLESANVACVGLSLLVTLVYSRVFPRVQVLQEFPLSSMSAYMFGLTNMTVPLVVSTIEWRPLTRNLVMPIASFGYLSVVALVILLAFELYRRSKSLASARQFVTRRVNAKLGLFRAPDATQLWIIGFFGLACLFYQAVVFSQKGAVGQGGIFARIIFEMITFRYAPFLIPLRSLYSRESSRASKPLVLALLGYFGLIMVAAVLRNDRSDFAMVPVIVLFSVLIGLLTLRIRIQKINYRVVVPILFATLVIYPLLADVAVAMYVVRRLHSKQGARLQLGLTIDMLRNRSQLHEYLSAFEDKTKSYDESYYNPSNVFLERFANMKFHDNGFMLSKDLTDRQRSEFTQFTVGHALSQFPSPVLRLAGLPIEKTDYNLMSVGDYLYYLNTGKGLGGFRVGSFAAHGLAIMGYVFFPFFGLVMVAYFLLFDSLTHRFAFRRKYLTVTGHIATKLAHTTPIFAPIVLLNSLSVLNPYRFGAMDDIPMYLLRGMPQQIIIYCLIIWMTRTASGTIDALRGVRQRPRIIPRHAAVALPGTSKAPVSTSE